MQLKHDWLFIFLYLKNKFIYDVTTINRSTGYCRSSSFQRSLISSAIKHKDALRIQRLIELLGFSIHNKFFCYCCRKSIVPEASSTEHTEKISSISSRPNIKSFRIDSNELNSWARFPIIKKLVKQVFFLSFEFRQQQQRHESNTVKASHNVPYSSTYVDEKFTVKERLIERSCMWLSPLMLYSI